MNGRLAGRVTLITGGGGGIGTATALRLASEGSAIAIADISREAAETAAKKVRDAGGQAIGLTADVSDPAAAEGAVRDAVAKFGKLTALVNMPAWSVEGTVETISLADWNRSFAVSLNGPFLASKYGVPEMRRAGGGAIVNIASTFGHMGVANRAPYCTTKAALLHFTRVLAMDHARDNIRANTISPGAIGTEKLGMNYGGVDKANAAMGPRHLLNRIGKPEEIAAAVAYLTSDDASFVTGTDLLVDGGYVTFKEQPKERVSRNQPRL